MRTQEVFCISCYSALCEISSTIYNFSIQRLCINHSVIVAEVGNCYNNIYAQPRMCIRSEEGGEVGKFNAAVVLIQMFVIHSHAVNCHDNACATAPNREGYIGN